MPGRGPESLAASPRRSLAGLGRSAAWRAVRLRYAFERHLLDIEMVAHQAADPDDADQPLVLALHGEPPDLSRRT
jgi:hypothetical protein